jgi:hypothetical protein
MRCAMAVYCFCSAGSLKRAAARSAAAIMPSSNWRRYARCHAPKPGDWCRQKPLLVCVVFGAGSAGVWRLRVRGMHCSGW